MTVERSLSEIFAEAKRADIEAVAGVKLFRNGRGLRGPCPLCGGSAGKKADGCFSANLTNGMWKCWKCDKYGDVITLERELRGGTPWEAAQRLIGLELAAPVDSTVRREVKEANDFPARVAAEIWGEAKAAEGSLAERYLVGRGIARDLARVALKHLRFHPSAYHSGPYREAVRLPAMVGRLRTPDGPTDGIHVTYLDPATGMKAKIAPAKKMWGAQSLNGVRGAVWLSRTAAKGRLVVGEGIESTLSAAQLTVWPAECRMVAALSLGGLQGGSLADRFGRLSLETVSPDLERPPFTWPEPEKHPWGEVLIAVDRDMSPVPIKVRKFGGGSVEVKLDADQRARICASLAIQAWKRTGAFCVVRAIAPGAGRDFNDELMERAS